MKKKIIATATDFREEKYVLCWLPERQDFAHWIVNSKGEHYLGRYFLNLNDAIDDFKDRVKYQKDGTNIDWQVPAQRWNEAQLVLFFELDKSSMKEVR